MRLAGSTVMLALLFGAAPALTQESPGILPTAAQSEAKAARAQAGKHAVRRKAAPQITAPETVSVKTITQEPGPVKSEPAIAESAEISPGDRLKIQSALLWSGDYTGSIGGEDPFLSAIKNYQKRAKSKITGILSASERANLLAAAKTYEDEFGWTIVTDPATGARLAFPPNWCRRCAMPRAGRAGRPGTVKCKSRRSASRSQRSSSQPCSSSRRKNRPT